LSKSIMSKNQEYNRVFITSVHDRTIRYECDNEKAYMKYLESHADMVEIIGGYNQYIKPVLDVDAYEEIDINKYKSLLNSLFPNKDVYYAKRNPREHKDKGMKYSYRFYVDGAKIFSKNLKQMLINKSYNNDPFIDMSIYDKNKVLYLPFTFKKVNETVPPLTPVDCHVFKCCASYIKEDFEDFNPVEVVVKNEPVLNIKAQNQTEDKDIENENENMNKYDKINFYISKLKPSRSDNYDTWTKLCWCIMNICEKEEISKRNCERLIHKFSKLSKKNYDKSKVDEWIDKHYDTKRDNGYGWTYLIHTCI